VFLAGKKIICNNRLNIGFVAPENCHGIVVFDLAAAVLRQILRMPCQYSSGILYVLKTGTCIGVRLQ